MAEPTEQQVRDVAQKLSLAQRDWLLKADRPMWANAPYDLYTYPPFNVLRVLERYNLMAFTGLLTPLGMAVRADLKAHPHAQ